MKTRELLIRLIPDLIGLAALALVVAGVWGLWGWEWAAIAAGLPPGAFYLWGEARDAALHNPKPERTDR